MLPFLFSNSPFETPTYYVLYLLAFLGAILFATYRAKIFDLSQVKAVDMGMVSFVSGVFGARLLHILIEAPDYYVMHPERVLYLWQGGFVLYGGLLFGVLGCYLFLRRTENRIGDWADVAAPCILLGIGIGRMGCLSAGCCYGGPTDWIWGMIFTDPRSGAPLHIALHPTQLLESLFGFGGAYIFHRLYLKPSRWPGSGLCFAAMAYSSFRFLIEFLRGDRDRVLFLNDTLSTSQFIAVGVFLMVAGFLAFIIKKSQHRHS